jgi:hypothetical protein
MQMKDNLILDKVSQFSHTFPLNIGWKNLGSFFLQVAARSSYVGETNVVAKAIDSSINRTPASP